MPNEIKKIIATIGATGAIVGGGFVASDKFNCDYEFTLNEQTVCVSQEKVDAVIQNMNNPIWDTPRAWDEL